MSLKAKIFLLLTFTSLFLAVSIQLMSDYFVKNKFIEIEKKEVQNITLRVKNTLLENLASLHRKSSDWSSWDDTYQYITDHNQEYIDINLQKETLQNLEIESILFLNSNDALVNQISQDTDLIKGNLLVQQLIGSDFAPGSIILSSAKTGNPVSGLLKSGNQLLMISARPILNSRGLGEPKGSLVFTRLIDKKLLNKFSSITHSDFDLIYSGSVQNIDTGIVSIDRNDEKMAKGAIVISDIYQNPNFLLTVQIPKEISQQVQSTLFFFATARLILIIITIAIIITFINFVVVRPLDNLSTQVRNIGASHAISSRLSVNGKDELSRFAEGINFMLADLEKAEDQIKKKSQETLNAKDASEHNMKKMEEQNRLLQDVQKAMFNLLEEEKALKNELQRQKENVEKLVAERTKELKEKTEALKIANQEVSKNWYAIQKEKATLSTSISSLPLGFIIIDPELNILTINETAKKFLKLSYEPRNLNDIDQIYAININIIKLINATRQNMLPTEIKEAILGNKYIHITLVPIVSQITEVQEFLGTVILIGDITERKLIDRSRNEFLSIASHELRTPLTAIRGNIKLISEFYKDKIPDQDFHEMLNDVHASSIRLIGLVNDFLNTSSLEMGNIEIKQENFDLKESIRKACDELKIQSDNKGLNININLKEEETLEIKGDRGRVHEVLINLIGNAVKFTPKGSITISCKQTPEYIETYITDTGMGINPKNQNLLFRKFQQAEDNIFTRDVTQGTGLGLYISKLLVEKMHGRIRLVESVENKGTTFSFYLPREKTVNQNGNHENIDYAKSIN